MNSDRLKNTLLNSTILTSIQVVTLLLKFITQTIFIHVLGKNFLGLNGLFTNIISMLSFAELGIGTSIVFSLYSPLAKKDERLISALMNFFKKAYNTIGFVVAAVGLVLIPFLPHLIKNYDSLNHVVYYYLLFLANSVLSYFFTYKRSLLIADQHEYVSAMNQLTYMVLQIALQIVILLFFKSYSFYLWIAIACTLISNINISKVVDKRYPYLKEFSRLKINKNEKITIKNNVIGMVGSKLGSIVVRSTDNLLLSAFLGIAIVGSYSNYLLITTSVSSVLTKLVGSVTASVGNLISEGNSKRSNEVYVMHFMINLFIVSIATGCLMVSLNPFISFWAGKTYVLSLSTVSIIVLNFFIDQLRQSSITFISAYGLFVSNGKKSIVEALLNLGLSILFLRGFNLGIGGVLLGTIITNIILNSWWEPWLLFKNGFKQENVISSFYINKYLVNVAINLFAIVIFSAIINKTTSLFLKPGLVSAILNSIIMLIFMLSFLFFAYRKNGAYKYLISILMKLKKRL